MKDIITKTGIQNNLKTNLDIEVYESVGSTNTLLKQRAKSDAAAPLLLVASHQSDGRGRMGRCFFSPDNTGIYMSLLLAPALPPDRVMLITTAAAVAVCRAIEELTPLTPQIKWVNDIFVAGRKVCGILTEAVFSSQSDKNDFAVLGIGINVYPPQSGFPDEISHSAGYLSEAVQLGFKDRLIAQIINIFFDIWQTDFADEYKNRCLVLGKQIRVITPDKIRTATALDVDHLCRLKVRYSDGTEALVSSGEISIKI